MQDSTHSHPHPSSPPPPLPALQPSARPYIRPVVHQGVSPLVVILLCLLLGMALAWGYGGERANWRMANSLNASETQLTALRADQSDLMAMLRDPETRVIPLQASASVKDATAVVVLDPNAQRGMLLCRNLWSLSKGEKYHLQAGGAVSEGTMNLSSFLPGRGITAVSFHIPENDSLTHFELWSGEPGGTGPLFTSPRS